MSRLVRTGLILAALRLLGGLVAFLATPIIAARFGLDPALDAFYVASSIPFVLSSVALVGGLETAVPPLFRRFLTTDASRANLADDETESWGFVNSLWSLALIGVAVVAVLSFILMPALLPRLAPGLDLRRQAVAVSMARTLLIGPTIAAPVGVWRGTLTAKNLLVGPAAILFAGSVAYFLVVAVAPSTLGAWTLVAATLSASLVALVALPLSFPKALTANLKFTLDFRHPGLPAALALLVPFAISDLIYHSDFVIMRGFASGVSLGAVAAYEFAMRPIAAASTLLLAGVVTPAFPELARTANNLPAFRAALDRTLKLMLVVALPLTIAFLFLREPIVAVLYQRGNFTAEDARQVSATLATLAPYFFLTALSQPLAYATYARQQPWWTVTASVIGLAFSAGGAYLLTPTLGLIGIAIGDGLGAVPMVGLLLLWRWRLNREGAKNAKKSLEEVSRRS
ncbi:MAG: polysaccharide biosynthesis C-terminal domain-containing protein [Chloroflexi bacterium]|nr:polysaccharide biosynthesis C-terminal domain-containing protein [Chloroflexota bacterium]